MSDSFLACRGCGACCATFRITLPCCELDTQGGQVPAWLTEPYTPTTACMREHPDFPDRCIALEGVVGQAVSCSIHDRRPAACRDFAPLSALGVGDDACDEARRRQGLLPLGTI
jgi:Fe-S-cluster containining protein